MAKSKTRSSPRSTQSAAAAAERVAAREDSTARRASELGTSAASAISIAIGLTLALRLSAAVEPSNWLWGLDTFGYRPPWETIALFALAVVGLAPPVAKVIDRALDSLGRAWERTGAVADAGLALAIGLWLFFARDPLHFTGDFAQRIGLFRSTESLARLLLERSFPLDTIANYEIPRWLIAQGVPVFDSLAWVGAVLGAAFVWTACRFARAAGARGAVLPTTVLVLVGGGAVVHFGGYDKFGPLLLGFACAAVGVVQAARGAGGIVWLAVGTTIALFAHRAGYLVLPAVAWTLVQRHRHDPGSRRQVLIAAVVVLAAAAIMAPRATHVVSSFDRRMHLPGGAVAESRVSRGAPPLVLRASDSANAVLFIVPLALLGLAAGMSRLARPPREPRERNPRSFSLVAPAALAVAAALALLLAVEPGAGWARDWDVATGPAVILSFLAAALLARAWEGGPRIAKVAPTVTLGLASAIALWGLQTRMPVALARVHALLEARPSLSEATRAQWHDFLGTRALNTKRPLEAIAEYQSALKGSPSPRLFTMLGLAHLAAGHRDSARAGFTHAVALDPNTLDAWMELARLAFADGDTAEVIRCLDSVLVREPNRADIRATRDELDGRSNAPAR
jgi:Tetratricopeptide repeat